MNTTLISNTVTRWFARRYSAHYAYIFYGTTGILSNRYAVSYAFRCQAVTLCRLD